MLVRILISWNLEVHRHLTLRELFSAILPPKMFLLLTALFVISLQQFRLYIPLHKAVELMIGGVLFLISFLPVLLLYRANIF